MGCLENALWSISGVLALSIPILLPPYQMMPQPEEEQLAAPLMLDSVLRSAVARQLQPVRYDSSGCRVLDAEQLETILTSTANRHQVQLEVLRAMVRRESAGHPCAVSPKGATGVLQLMPATARHFGVKNIRDPMQNIDAGAKFLKQLLVRYNNNLKFALAAYNAGPAAVDRYGGVPPFEETQNYVKAVSRAAEEREE